MGGAPETHSSYRPGHPAQAMAAGSWIEILPARGCLGLRPTGRKTCGGRPQPLDATDRILICSYHFAANKAQDLARVPGIWSSWTRLTAFATSFRSPAKSRAASWTPSAVAQDSLDRHPLQNSLMELYGLASVIDGHLFGDEVSFRDHYPRHRRAGPELAIARQA